MKKPLNKVQAQSASAASVAVVIAWLWNSFLPEYEMPAEVAASLGAFVGPVGAWLLNWLPKAGD
jgi:hypothetical protein